LLAGALASPSSAFAQSSAPGPYGPSTGYAQPGYGTQPTSPAPGYPNNQSQQPSLSSGGLAPPPGAGTTVGTDPFAPAPASSGTEADLERADREDSGRGLEFVWLDAELGFEHLGLQTFKANKLVDAASVATTQTGPLFGAGLGVRLVFVTLGARFRLGTFSDWQLWTLNAELGLHVPIGALEPYFTLGGGYASVGSFDSKDIGASIDAANVRIRGFDVRAGLGLDYYLSDVFSLGANLTGEVLALTRPGVDISKLQSSGSTNAQQAQARVYSADGSSVGSGLSLTAVAGLHF
jgi:hypothetical protein